MVDIVVQKDANNLIAKTGLTAAQREAWAVDFTIYDINADGTKGAAYGPTRAKTNRPGNVTLDAYGNPKISPTGDSAAALAALVSGAGNLRPAVVRAAVIGDSYDARGNGNTVVTAASRSGGVATYTCTSHGLATGQIATFCNMQNNTFNLQNVVVTRIDANNVSAACPGPDASTTNLDGLANGSTKKPMTVLNRSSRADNGYLQRLVHESGGTIRIAHNGGAPGQTAADMLERFDREFTQFAGVASLLIVHTGYNPFAIAGRTADAEYADVLAIVGKGRALGMLVCVVNCTPWVTGGTATNRAEAARYNRLLLGLQQSQVRVADACRALIDATNATGMYPLANMVEATGVHLTAKGNRFFARAIWNSLSPGWPTAVPLVASNVDNYGALNTNKNILDAAPWAAGSAANVNAPVTGTVPTGYAVSANNASGSGTFACTGTARGDGIGYDLVATITSGGPSDTFTVNFSSNVPAARFAPGDKVLIQFELALTGTSGANLKGINCNIYFQGGTQNPQDYLTTTTSTTAAEYGATDEVIRMISEEIVIPADGSTGYGFQMIFQFSAAGTALVAKYGGASHEKV